jgi:hypothetical protein
MARNNKRNRRNRRHGEAQTTQAAIGPCAVAYAAKHASADIAQITTPGVDQSHCWSKLEDASVYTDRRVSTDASRNWYDARRRYESASFRGKRTSVAIPWGSPGSYQEKVRKRLERERGSDFITPERRIAGKPYLKYEGR